ncbi:hypothetical protein [Companilactobacillus sp. DQM5]
MDKILSIISLAFMTVLALILTCAYYFKGQAVVILNKIKNKQF